jgi:hypothetical protein
VVGGGWFWFGGGVGVQLDKGNGFEISDTKKIR